jgi:preprotein translocase subunit SecG
MSIFQLLAVGVFMKLIAAFLVICSVVMIFIILIQKGKGGGLSGAFGGGAASGLLGSKTGDFLTWTTITLAALFFVLLVLMAKFYRPTISDVGQNQPAATEQPMSPVSPATPARPVSPVTPPATGQPAKPTQPAAEQPAAPVQQEQPASETK